MSRTPKNPNVERVARMPFDKDTVSPMPQIVPRARVPGADERTDAADAAESTTEQRENTEPGGPGRAKGASHGRA